MSIDMSVFDNLELDLQKINEQANKSKSFNRGFKEQDEEVVKDTKENNTETFFKNLRYGDFISNQAGEVFVFDKLLDNDGGVLKFIGKEPIFKDNGVIQYSTREVGVQFKYFKITKEQFDYLTDDLNDISDKKREGIPMEQQSGKFVVSSRKTTERCGICNAELQEGTLDFALRHMNKAKGTMFEGVLACRLCQVKYHVYDGKGLRSSKSKDTQEEKVCCSKVENTLKAQAKKKSTSRTKMKKQELIEALEESDIINNELKAENKELKSQLDTQGKEINELKNMINELKNMMIQDTKEPVKETKGSKKSKLNLKFIEL